MNGQGQPPGDGRYYGAPVGPGQPQPGYGPPTAGYAQPQTPGYGPPQPYPPAGGAAYGAPARKLGLFQAIPCPFCGAAMNSSSSGATAGRMVGGLVGWLVVMAFSSRYYCPTHGQVKTAQMPPEHQSMITLRRLMFGGGAAALLFVVLILVVVVALING